MLFIYFSMFLLMYIVINEDKRMFGYQPLFVTNLDYHKASVQKIYEYADKSFFTIMVQAAQFQTAIILVSLAGMLYLRLQHGSIYAYIALGVVSVLYWINIVGPMQRFYKDALLLMPYNKIDLAFKAPYIEVLGEEPICSCSRDYNYENYFEIDPPEGLKRLKPIEFEIYKSFMKREGAVLFFNGDIPILYRNGILYEVAIGASQFYYDTFLNVRTYADLWLEKYWDIVTVLLIIAGGLYVF